MNQKLGTKKYFKKFKRLYSNCNVLFLSNAISPYVLTERMHPEHLCHDDLFVCQQEAAAYNYRIFSVNNCASQSEQAPLYLRIAFLAALIFRVPLCNRSLLLSFSCC